jgi:hypothetical protein
MSRIADPLRERVRELGWGGMDEWLTIADAIDAEHTRRMSQSRREVRRDFARYMRSCIEDYVKGTARRNRNHAHVRVTDPESGKAICTQCGIGVGIWDNYCFCCGAKLTAIEDKE